MQRCAAAVILLTFATCPVAAQTQQVDKLQATAEEVVLDLIVRDKSGHPARDVRPERLTVLDNGSPRPVKSLRLIDGREVIAAGSAAPAGALDRRLDPLRQIRLVTLVFDSLGQEARRFARQGALDFVQNVPANALCAVTTVDSRLRVLREFTVDRDALKKSIEFATSGKVTQFASTSSSLQRQLELTVGESPAGVAPEENTLLFVERQNQIIGTSNAATPAGAAAIGEARIAKLYAETLLRSIRFDETTVRERSGQSSIQALMALARGQALLPGRKVILYFSNGLYIPHTPGRVRGRHRRRQPGQRQCLRARPARPPRRHGKCQGARGTRGRGPCELRGDHPEFRLGRFAGAVRLRRAGDLQRSRHRELAVANLQNALAALASGTGGFLIANTNDFRPALRRVNEEINTYYELTYDPGLELHDAAFHRTEVKSSRPELKIQARSGYYALAAGKGFTPRASLRSTAARGSRGSWLRSNLSFFDSILTIEPAPGG